MGSFCVTLSLSVVVSLFGTSVSTLLSVSLEVSSTEVVGVSSLLEVVGADGVDGVVLALPLLLLLLVLSAAVPPPITTLPLWSGFGKE